MSTAPGNAADTAAAAARAPRRASYRARAEIPAVVARAGVAPPPWARCWVRDLSTTGGLIEGTLGFEPGESVRLRFGKPNAVMTFDATVMRIDEEGRLFGLRFDALGDHDAKRLYELVMELAQEYVKYRARHLAWEPATAATRSPLR